MKKRSANCPACAAPVVFGFGTVVAVCDFCQSAVARSDKSVEDYGKVSDIAETGTRLCRGMTGKFRKKSFTIVGRVQYRHPAGGVWDEWYLRFPDGTWGWLADSQGRFFLTFERKIRSGAMLPDFDSLEVGREVEIAGLKLHVIERGVAANAGAEGEIPWAFHSGQEHRFVDLRDTDGKFATLEFGESTKLFCGQEVSLADLQLSGEQGQLVEEKIATSAVQLNCPNCAGQLALRAPDKSLRVTCPHCNSLLDVTAGKLSYLRTMQTKERFPLVIPLGSEGELFGTKYTVIGFMRRYAMWNGTTFPWNEYLLYEPSVGFRWLVHNSRHWSFVEPVPQPLSSKLGRGKQFTYAGTNFRLYDRGEAYVRYVVGEFYWKVQVGDKVRTADFIAPPRMISFEWSGTDKSQEVNVSLGRYVSTDDIERAFGLKEILRPMGVGVIQPGPWPSQSFFLVWGCLLAILLMTQATFTLSNRENETPDAWLCFYGMLMVSAVPIAFMAYRWSFEVKRWEDSDYSPYATE